MKYTVKQKILPLLAVLLSFLICISLATVFAASASASAAPVPGVATGDDMIASGKLYNASAAGRVALKPFNGVVASSGQGRLVYDEEVSGIDIDVRFTSGESVFFVLRANDDKAIWDGGHGYFLMANKNASGVGLQLLKGAETGTAFTMITSGSIPVNIFDGEKHNLRYLSEDADGKVSLSFSVDGTQALAGEDTSSVYPVAGSHYLMCSGSSDVMYKIYAADGEDVDISGAEYLTITSKTLLKSTTNWTLRGTSIAAGESVTGNRDQSIALYSRALKDCVYSFDIKIEDVQNNWVAVLLNANKADMLWNSGFRSVVVFFRQNDVSIEYWTPQQSIASIVYSGYGISLDETLHVECGMYTVSLSTGDYTYIKLSVNGKELYNEPLLTEGVSTEAGSFGLINYGTAKYTMYATSEEIDRIPSSTDGARTEREDETEMNGRISVSDWAVIANSVNPSWRVDGEIMTVSNDGFVAYKNSVNFTKIAFELKFSEGDKTGQYAEFSFGKKRQNSFAGATLADDYTNYGYGLRILPSGAVAVVKTDSGAGYKTLMNFDGANDFGLDFEDGLYHDFTVYRSLTEAGLKLALFVDGEEYGFAVTDDDYYAPNYPLDGFLSFGNSANGTSYSVRNIRYEGAETDVASSLLADAVNFVTYFEEEGRKFVYFCFDSASYTTRWAEIYASDKDGTKKELLGTVFPNGSTFDLDDYAGGYVLVKSVGFTEAGSKYELLETKAAEPPVTDRSEVKRIAIKESDGGAYFVYAGTDEEFVPMGGNYMGLRGGDHSTFDAATTFTEADYDPVKTEAMFKALSENNGNVVRVFLIGRSTINPGISGDPAYDIDDENYYYEGLYKPYMENVVHFLRTAQSHGVYVMLTLGDADVPSNAYYLALQGGSSLARNYMYMTANGVNARKTYARNVVNYFKTFAPDCMSGIFSLELQNEFAVYADQWPFTLTEGTVTLANGKTYDMGDVDSRELAFKESVAYYINQVSSAIKAADGELLVNEGTFTRNIVGNNGVYGMQGIVSGDYRVPATMDVYLSTNIDFLDVHIYFANTKGNTIMNSFADDLTYMNFYSAETQALLRSKCIFMGEFGPNKNIFNTQEKANEAWRETVRLATEVGIKGFAVWTLESHSQTECWNILADDGKFDTFRELVRIRMGVENTDNISAEDLTVKLGEEWSPILENLAEGDEVLWSLDGESYVSELPALGEAGVYTLFYRVARRYADTAFGSFAVTVENGGADDSSDSSSGSSSGNSSGGSASVGCGSVFAAGLMAGFPALLAAAAVPAKRKKRD